MKSAVLFLFLPIASCTFEPFFPIFNNNSWQLASPETFKNSLCSILFQALNSPSEASPLIIQEVINIGGDVMEAIYSYLKCRGTTLQNVERIISILPKIDGKCHIPCVSHYGSLYSLCSKFKPDEIIPVLELVASVSATPATSVDAWNTISEHLSISFDGVDRRPPQISKALNILLEKGCPSSLPLLYKNYPDILKGRFEGAIISPNGEVGWYNPMEVLLWIDEAIGIKYMVHSLVRFGANPNERIFSYVSFNAQERPQTRSILCHVLALLLRGRFSGNKQPEKIATLLIAFGAETREYLRRDPNAIEADPFDVDVCNFLLAARKKIQFVKEKLWLLQFTYPELDSDTRWLIGEILCSLVL